MICYKDKTFCMADCKNTKCSRFMTPELEDEARSFGLPVAMADFSDNCADYIPNEVKE